MSQDFVVLTRRQALVVAKLLHYLQRGAQTQVANEMGLSRQRLHTLIQRLPLPKIK